jgi:hypothetical protein
MISVQQEPSVHLTQIYLLCTNILLQTSAAKTLRLADLLNIRDP